jgi:hypothetical protein
LPGVNAPVPPGGVGPKGFKAPGLAKLLRAFDNTRDVAELAPYGEAADAWLQAAVTQLSLQYGDCGPLELSILRGAAEQMFWSQVFFARARDAIQREDGTDAKLGHTTKLVEIASRITDSCRANILAANALRAARKASEDGDKPPVDPLAKFTTADEEPS